MCKVLLHIRPSVVESSHKVFVPCGHCDECRIAQQNAWSWRLRAEIESLTKYGWRVGFFTLTYNDDNLPHFADDAFDVGFSEPVMCFSRSDVRLFVDDVRKALWREYGITKDERLRYIICSEYGEHTHRPHYHGIFIYPPKISDEQMHGLIKRYWTKGFICPAHYLGCAQYNIAPFACEGDSTGCAIYAGKYCCKDLAFGDYLARFQHLNRKSKAFKDGMQFHIQSKSLGLVALKDLTDTQKLELLKDGKSFVGSDKLIHPPLYIKNKIFFDNYYILSSDGRRLCRRKASSWLLSNYKEVCKQKLKFFSELFVQMETDSFWLARSADSTLSKSMSSLCHSFNSAFGTTFLASRYISSFGCQNVHWFNAPFADLWLARYSRPVRERIKASSPCMPFDVVKILDDFYSYVFSVLSSFEEHSISDNLRLMDELRDFHSNQMVSYV